MCSWNSYTLYWSCIRVVLTDNSTVCDLFSSIMHAHGREYSLLLVTQHILQGGALNGQPPEHMHSTYVWITTDWTLF